MQTVCIYQVVANAGMAAVKDPAPFQPYTIAAGRPGVFGQGTPSAGIIRRVAVDAHHTGVLPLDLHVVVMASRALSAVGTGLLGRKGASLVPNVGCAHQVAKRVAGIGIRELNVLCQAVP